jgi:hypothetical protein
MFMMDGSDEVEPAWFAPLTLSRDHAASGTPPLEPTVRRPLQQRPPGRDPELFET